MKQRLYNTTAHDAMQLNLFVTSEASRINAQVYRIEYADVRYRGLVPVDTAGPEWRDAYTFISLDGAGAAEWLNTASDDVPKVAFSQDKAEAFVNEAGIGYDFTLREVQKAQQMGFDLPDTKARVARRAAEEMIDRVTWAGDAMLGLTGIINNPYVPVQDAAPTGTGSSTRWKDKTPGQILADVNALLSGIWEGTGRTTMADTLVVPDDAYVVLATTLLPDGGGRTLLDWIQTTNLYTAATRRTLTIVPIYELRVAGEGSTPQAPVSRAVAYRNSEDVVVLRMPMPFRFFPVWQTGPWRWDVPGMFRMGGVEYVRPREASYMDGI